ncbi:MAG: hypothetical protein QME50_04245 [Candidatus Bathyarchaeota archaeon]|nr:hypothetical protein [Candidatus Bathyarchaeota archaeon]
MSSRHLQYYVEERKTRRESQEFLEAHHRMPDGKLIETVQICLRCRRKFPFKRSRKHCPRCQGLLRTKAMVLKVP